MPGLHRFFLDYAIVKHSLRNDQGVFEELMALNRLDPRAANFLADFWWSKSRRECSAFANEVAERYARRGTSTMPEAEKDRLVKQAREEIDQCRYGVYYDHWDEINRMIMQRYESVLRQQKRNSNEATPK